MEGLAEGALISGVGLPHACGQGPLQGLLKVGPECSMRWIVSACAVGGLVCCLFVCFVVGAVGWQLLSVFHRAEKWFGLETEPIFTGIFNISIL